ncbi:MAG TPA: glycosyltransferase family 4 protein, partial [Isosphaeraceae bacterium]|nr:glycosyltransferase family 4 protein [Isosphaeraceae bacterium]
EPRGFLPLVLCVDAGEGFSLGSRVIECSALQGRWRRYWAARGLTSPDGPPRPELLHVVDRSMADVGLALAERWKTPYVLTIDDYLPAGARLRLSKTWCRGVVATSEALAAELVETVGIPRRALQVVIPGIDPPEEREPKPQGPESARLPVVGATGRFETGSGLATFLHAASLIIQKGLDAEFVIAGWGSGEATLRRLADALRISDRVTFADVASDLRPFWSVLDVFCFTSTRPTTGLGLAQALAFGAPSIAADVPGLGDWFVHERTGLRIPPSDSEALAEAIQSMLRDPQRSHEFGRLGREEVLRVFDLERQARELEAVYRLALDSTESLIPRPRSMRPDTRPGLEPRMS